MSELAQLPTQEIIDRHEMSRILSDAELIKMGAEIVNGVLTVSPEQIEELAKQSPISHDMSYTDKDSVMESSEQDTTTEKLGEWLDAMPISAHTWVARDLHIPRQNYLQGGSYNRFTTLTANPSMFKANNAIEKLSTPPVVSKELRGQGVSEAITFAAMPDGKFGDFSKDSPKAEEDVVHVLYETLIPYTNKSNGNVVRLRMMLPRTEAEVLRQMLDSDPEVMRVLLEKLMTEKLQAQEAWENSRPPYEKWKEANGGVSKIAVRSGLISSAKDSKILEF